MRIGKHTTTLTGLAFATSLTLLAPLGLAQTSSGKSSTSTAASTTSGHCVKNKKTLKSASTKSACQKAGGKWETGAANVGAAGGRTGESTTTKKKSKGAESQTKESKPSSSSGTSGTSGSTGGSTGGG